MAACAVTGLKRVTNLELSSACSTSALHLMILFAERRTDSGGLWVARFFQFDRCSIMPRSQNQFVLVSAAKAVAAIGGRLTIPMCEIVTAK
jgi:hypothetical protein